MTDAPILIMIGGMRCGTRALQRYLSQHPEILPHEKAHDPNFFSSNENWAKGVDHYLSGWADFDPDNHKYKFESSTHYTKYPSIKNVPERMAASGLDIRFIYGVRDPIARIESHMQHNAGKGYLDPYDKEHRNKFLKIAINISKYKMQLERYLKYYDESLIYVYQMERLLKEPDSVIDKLTDLYGLDKSFEFKEIDYVTTKFKKPVDEAFLDPDETRQALKELQGDIEWFIERHNLDRSLWPKYQAAREDVRSLWPTYEAARDNFRKSALLSAADRILSPAVRRTFTRGGRYAFLTVDTEALPNRAPYDQVKRLIWGEHENGTAGIREMINAGKDHGARHIFFVDTCEVEIYGDEIRDVVRWLNGEGEDVQLHVHPELLPANFWKRHKIHENPKYMNLMNYNKTRFILKYFADEISNITGKSVRACRTGSFRWNSNTIRAMGDLGIMYSFNDTLNSYRTGKSAFSAGSLFPYKWSNGVTEFPTTEITIPKTNSLRTFKFPLNGNNKKDKIFIYDKCISDMRRKNLVLLLHSWSLLHWSNNHSAYMGQERIEEYHDLLKKISKDFDIISTEDIPTIENEHPMSNLNTVPLEIADFAEEF